MLNDDPGKSFRDRSAPRQDKRGAKVDPSARILIVDPVLGSRFSLAQAVAHPGYVVKAASTVEEALSHLDRGDVSLAGLSSETLRLLSKARQSLRVTRLDDGSSRTRAEVEPFELFRTDDSRWRSSNQNLLDLGGSETNRTARFDGPGAAVGIADGVSQNPTG